MLSQGQIRSYAPMIAQMTLTAWLFHMSIQDSDGRIHNPNAG